MHYSLWICLVIALSVLEIESEPDQGKIKSQCQVSDLHLTCSSSNSVQFKWKRKSQWIFQCNNQIFNVKYFQQGTNRNNSSFSKADIFDQEILITGLQRDTRYEFYFVHKIDINNQLYQVANGFYKREATTHGAGSVKSLKIADIEPASAKVVWSTLGGEGGCISHYTLQWCWTHAPGSREECESRSVATRPEQYTLQNLTACTSYSLTITAVDIDHVVSSENVSQKFTTASEEFGSVKGLHVYNVRPDSLSVVWIGSSCNLYNVSIRDSEFLQQHSQIVSDTSYTFSSLRPCSSYHISVSALPPGGLNEWRSSSQVVQANTSIASKATVNSLRIYGVTENSLSIYWQPPTPWLMCISSYQVQVLSEVNHAPITSHSTKLSYLVIGNLQHCTSYSVFVTVVFSGYTLSQESLTISARTNAPAIIMNQRVENVSVINQTPDSLHITWERPQLGSNCLQGYNVFLYDSRYNVVYNQSSVPPENRSFIFFNLRQCERYFIHITPVFGNSISNEPTPFIRPQEFTETFTVTTDTLVVTNLSVEVGWNTLQVQWTPPLGYEVCTRQYQVRVCAESQCQEPVTVEAPSYHLAGLRACTSYIVEVRAEHSNAVSTMSSVTRGPGKIISNQLEAVNETSDSITFRWEIPEGFSNCKEKFEISLWDDKGFVIEHKKLNNLTGEYIAQSLKSCNLYSFKLTSLDFAEIPTIDYTVVKSITKASGDQKVQGLEASPYHGGMMLGWSMPPESSACVSHYQVSLKGRDGSSAIYNTTALTFTWLGDPCSLDYVSVQLVSQHQLVGQPAHVLLSQQFEDMSKLSLKVAYVGSRVANVRLISAGFGCVTFTISWYRVTNRSTTDSVANLTSLPNQTVTLNQLDPCSTYSVTVTPQNGHSKIEGLNTTVTTNYAEPVLIPGVRPISRGFNISWQLYKYDTRYCLSHVRVAVKNSNFHEEVKVFGDPHKVIGDLIPCQKYLITVDGLAWNGKSGKTYHSKWEKVSPEVLPVPATATLVNVTKESATIDWDVGSSDTNMCEPSDLKADCHPDIGLNMYIAGWSPVTLHLSRLKPYTRYNCMLVVINQAGQSNGTHISFITSEGVPSQPKNIAVTASSSSEVSVRWEPPDQVPGVLTNYTVFVYNQTLQYLLPSVCSPPPLGPRHLVVGGNITHAIVGELSPASSLKVSVTAATAAGSGPPSEPVTSATLDGVSDPVVGLNVTLVHHEVMLSWRLPCLANGLLDHFLVELNGTRPNHNTTFYSWDVTVEQTLFKNYSTAINISLLTAEALYSAAVVPIGLSGLAGQHSSQNFTVPSRIPTRASKEVFAELPAVRTTQSTATVYIRSDLFPDTEGTIRYYAVIVAGNFSFGPVSGQISNQSWPRIKTWAEAIKTHPIPAYQATKPWWNPFKGMDTTPFAIKQYDLGTEECSKTDYRTYCNGPLLSGTSYAIRIRAFTRTGYRDSQSIPFKTVDPIVEAYLIIMALVVLAVVTTVAFIYLAVIGHIKWIKEKKGLAKLTHKTEETNEYRICERLPLVKFINHVENIATSESSLDEEFKHLMRLTIQTTGTVNIARLPHNIVKNRYTNIIPYDSALVTLEGDEENSYINGSHIKIQGKKSMHYIACQGPKEETSEDFWRMIIQYKVNPIVMLCMLHEQGKVKCFPYFPINSGEVVNFGGISVHCTREEISSNYIIRYLTVDKQDGTNTRVQHFHFTQWIDHGVPDRPEFLVEFIEDIRKVFKHKPTVMAVHCSAGVGRTGTFIVVDELLRKIRSTWRCRMSVADTVLQLREQRHRLMVQTQDQYGFIYKCLKYALENDKSWSERVRNFLIRRSKVEIGNEEMIQMDTSPR